MIDRLIDGLLTGAAAGAASGYARRRLANDRELIWSGEQPDGTTLVIERALSRGRVTVELAVISGGQCIHAGSFRSYADCYAAVQQWQAYLASGGTVATWTDPTQTRLLTTREAPAIENYSDDAATTSLHWSRIVRAGQ